MAIVIRATYQGEQREFHIEHNVVTLGRENVDVDLSPDLSVSRRHATISRVDGQQLEYWIEELRETPHGTWINGERIESKKRIRIYEQDEIVIGTGTTLKVIFDQDKSSVKKAPTLIGFTTRRGESGHKGRKHEDPGDENNVLVSAYKSAAAPTEIFLGDDQFEVLVVRHHLNTVYQLSEALGLLTDFQSLIQTLVDYVYRALQHVSNCGVLLLDEGDRLTQYFALPPGNEAPYSETLAWDALSLEETRNWQLREQPTVSNVAASIVAHNFQAAIYAPLIWQDEPYGVLYVNNQDRVDAFTDDEVRLMQALARQAALFFKNQNLQAALRQEEIMRANLLRHFSPQLADRLLRHGEQFHMGGELASPVTVLMSDIRGFTASSARMEPQDVMRLLNEMFSRLTPIIFHYSGVIDKYIGDAILAVFGSPDPDEDQLIHAIQAALEMQQVMSEMQSLMRRDYGVEWEIGIAIHTGSLVHGFMGSAERLEYTVIGDTVNRTARLCDKAAGGTVIISEDVYRRMGHLLEVDSQVLEVISKHVETEGVLRAYVVRSLNIAAG